MTGVDLPQLIYSLLSSDEELQQMVDVENNIVPLMTPPTNYPFVMYTRDSVQPIYTKDGLSEDVVLVSITVVDDGYINACKIVSRIRDLLEYKSYHDNNFDISLIEVSGVYEDFSQDAYIQTLTLNVKIKY